MTTRDYHFDLELCRELNRQRHALEAERPKRKNFKSDDDYIEDIGQWSLKLFELNKLAKSKGFMRIFDGSYKLDARMYPAHN